MNRATLAGAAWSGDADADRPGDEPQVASPRREAPAHDDGERCGRRLRVLIVEDEILTLLDLEQLVAVLGYEVCGTALTARDAVHAAAALRPDLMLTDIRLSGGSDGISAAGAIRDQLGIPAVYLTAHSDEATRRRADATRPLGFLPKPYSIRQIRDTLRTAEGVLGC